MERNGRTHNCGGLYHLCSAGEGPRAHGPGKGSSPSCIPSPSCGDFKSHFGVEEHELEPCPHHIHPSRTNTTYFKEAFEAWQELLSMGGGWSLIPEVHREVGLTYSTWTEQKSHRPRPLSGSWGYSCYGVSFRILKAPIIML